MKIELLTADHQNKPDVGATIARDWIDNDHVEAIVDVPTSSVALAVNEIIRQKNKTFLASGPFTSVLTGQNCSPNTVHWTVDNWALAHSLASAAVEAGDKTWFFITSDYAFGHDLESVARAAIIANGGEVLGSVKHPLNTSDFASYLLTAQASPAKVIGFANAGNDTTNSIKQASEFGILRSGKKLAGLATIINNIDAIGLKGTAGMLVSSPFYWDQDDNTRTWAKRFEQLHPRHNKPNEMQAGVYAVLLHYFKALKHGVDPSDGRAVVDEMKRIPTDDPLFGRGAVRIDGRAIHPMYLFEVKLPSENPRTHGTTIGSFIPSPENRRFVRWARAVVLWPNSIEKYVPKSETSLSGI